jgi:hypothetical protein
MLSHTLLLPQLVASVLPQHLQAAAVELGGYFADSFGNTSRIDYGTGEHGQQCTVPLQCTPSSGRRVATAGEGSRHITLGCWVRRELAACAC